MIGYLNCSGLDQIVVTHAAISSNKFWHAISVEENVALEFGGVAYVSPESASLCKILLPALQIQAIVVQGTDLLNDILNCQVGAPQSKALESDAHSQTDTNKL